MPLTFIRKLHRPLPERILISCLMALGLLATASAIYKTSIMDRYSLSGDTSRDVIPLNTWAKIEEQLGIIAACIPPLKAPIERLLRKIGIPTLASISWPSSYFSGSTLREWRKSTGVNVDREQVYAENGSIAIDTYKDTQASTIVELSNILSSERISPGARYLETESLKNGPEQLGQHAF